MKKTLLGFLRFVFFGERYVESAAEAQRLAKSPRWKISGRKKEEET